MSTLTLLKTNQRVLDVMMRMIRERESHMMAPAPGLGLVGHFVMIPEHLTHEFATVVDRFLQASQNHGRENTV